MRSGRVIPLVLASAAVVWSAEPKMICFSATPNPYLTDHAAEIKKIYDGFFFGGGNWEDAAKRFVGTGAAKPEAQAWMDQVRGNLAALKRAGVTENLLTVYWPSNPKWPAPETLRSEEFTRHMAEQFTILGRTARNLGFRGVCLDLEYAAERWEVHHPQYHYDAYTVEDLQDAAFQQGYKAMSALLDAYPEAVVWTLPGQIRHWAIAMYYQLGMIQAMAERDAPGGFHLGSEWTYYIRDSLTSLGVSRFEDPAVEQLAGKRAAAYWKRRCSVAPGVWPLHMTETDRNDVPVRPWKQELEEIRQQMKVVRSASKFYLWSFTGTPFYYVHTPELEQKYKLPKQTLKHADVDVRDWHRLLTEKPVLRPGDPFYQQVEAARRWDRGEISALELCDAFGTPGRWWLLALTGSLRRAPQYAAMRAALGPVDPRIAHLGRDTAMRWTPMDSLNPMGTTNLRYHFGYQGTDHSGAHLVAYLHSPKAQKGFLDAGWDDGIRIYFGEKMVLDALDYPGAGKGMIRNDSFIIEKRIPVDIPAGRTRITVSTMNDHGLWIFCLRFTGEKGVPLPGLKFRLE